MEFISAEEFLKQDKKVQEVFIDWWKPQLFDLYAYKEENKPHRVTDFDLEEVKEDDFLSCKNMGYPLLTEGQLRKFIEDKTGCYFSCEIINPLVNEEGFRFVFEFYSGKEFKYNGKLRKEIYAIDLLQAYWKVAVEIASKGVKEQ